MLPPTPANRPCLPLSRKRGIDKIGVHLQCLFITLGSGLTISNGTTTALTKSSFIDAPLEFENLLQIR